MNNFPFADDSSVATIILDGTLERVDCPICGPRDYRVLRQASYPAGLDEVQLLEVYRSSGDRRLMDQLVSCRGCNLVYLNPRVRSDLILRSYAEAIDPVFFEQNTERIRTFGRALRPMIRRFALVPERTRILDVGSAGGAFPKAATDLGFKVVGIEPSLWLCEQGHKAYNVDLRPGHLVDQGFADASFDIVTLWDVLEHMTNPGRELCEIRRVLRPGGLLIVNIPDSGSLASRLLGERWPFLLSVHLYYFTLPTLTRYLRLHGFEVLEMKPFWQTLSLGYALRRAIPCFGLFSVAEKAVRALRLDRLPLTYTMGQSTVVARRSDAVAAA